MKHMFFRPLLIRRIRTMKVKVCIWSPYIILYASTMKCSRWINWIVLTLKKDLVVIRWISLIQLLWSVCYIRVCTHSCPYHSWCGFVWFDIYRSNWPALLLSIAYKSYSLILTVLTTFDCSIYETNYVCSVISYSEALSLQCIDWQVC